MTVLARARVLAVWVLAVVILAGTGWAFAQSYHALYDWAVSHDVPRPFAFGFPVTVDMFVLFGEGRLFIAAIDEVDPNRAAMPLRIKAWYWALALGGLAVSLAGNVGHVGPHAALGVRLTAAIAPTAAAIGLIAGLGLVKTAAVMPEKVSSPHPQPNGKVLQLEERRKTSAKGRGKVTPALLRDVRAALDAGDELTIRGAARRFGVSRHVAKDALDQVRAGLREEEVASG